MGAHSRRTEYMFIEYRKVRDYVVSTSSLGEHVSVPETMTSSEVIDDLWAASQRQAEANRLRKDAWWASLEKFRATVSRRSLGTSDDGPRIRLTFSDGEIWDGLVTLSGIAIRKEFEAAHGLVPDRSEPETRAQWEEREQPEVHGNTMWRCRVGALGGSVERYPAGDGQTPSFGGPLNEIAALLNEYGASGWSVVHSDTDKGIYAGSDTENVSSPVGFRYLLGRSTSG